MSLIKCPNCEQEISEQTKKCPNCGLRLLYGKRNIKNTAILCVILVLSIFGVLVLRNNQLKNLKNKVEKYYSELNFEGVEECYQKMKFWFYDTSEKEEILEYDKKVYKDAKKYYDTLKKVDDSLNKNSYRSLRSLLNKLEDPTEKFSDLEINKKSKIGQYINNIRTNPAYDAFNSEMVNNDKYNVDDGLVSGGYSVVISVYTSTLLEEEFPYMGGK